MTAVEAPVIKARLPVEEKAGVFVYIGPTLPGGSVKQNAVIHGTREQAVQFLREMAPEFPQAAGLLVPVAQLARAKQRIAACDNLLAERYGAIIAAMGRKG